MFLIKILSNTYFFLLLHIWQRVGLTNQVLQLNTTYPNISSYHSNVLDPVKNCPGFVCDLSKLSQSVIETIVNAENNQRMDYARAKRITNLYRVFWDDRLAKYARVKVQMCLPPTFENKVEKYQIFDERAVVQIYPEDSTIRRHLATVQIVSGLRQQNSVGTEAQLIAFRSKFIDYYIALFYSNDINFRLRGATTLMGCGYIFQQSNTSFTDRLLCAYGMFYTHHTDNYIATVGQQPCSNCTYFKDRYYSDSRQSAVGRVEQWGCDLMYSSLCNDINKKPILVYEDMKFDCNHPEARLGFDLDLDQPIRQMMPPSKSKSDEVPVPCWYITAPLGLVTIVILGLCVFHTTTAAMTYINYRKRRQQRVAK